MLNGPAEGERLKNRRNLHHPRAIQFSIACQAPVKGKPEQAPVAMLQVPQDHDLKTDLGPVHALAFPLKACKACNVIFRRLIAKIRCWRCSHFSVPFAKFLVDKHIHDNFFGNGLDKGSTVL